MAYIDRETLLDLIIRRFGFEHERTIAFANAMEYLEDEELIDLFNIIME